MTTFHPTPVSPGYPKDDGSRSQTLASLFTAVCKVHGQRIALTFETESVTYRDLERRSDCVAAGLLAYGAGPETIVAICIDRSPAMIVAMLAVAKTGAAYLPLDPGYPSARLEETIADAVPIAVVTNAGMASRLRYLSTDCLFLEDLEKTSDAGFQRRSVTEDDPAYVIYTSGSTGRPKGVVVSHRNVARLLTQSDLLFGFTHHDVWTLFHSFAFDFSVWEIWGCLLSGGRLVIVPFAVSRSPDDFYDLLLAQRVTVLNQTPSAFVLLDQVDQLRPCGQLSLRLVIFGGEALSFASLRGWFARHAGAQTQLVNMYGITETTVHATCRIIRATDAAQEHESLIGAPLGDLQVHLLDANLCAVPDGSEGELCIAGAGVTLGYLNRPALTAERFRPDPWGAPGARLYRSGDLARRREDGELVYLGRRDGQVKINGFRVELGEIETALITHPAIVQACVTAPTDCEGNTTLAAYFVAQYGREPGTREISEYLATRLPRHMMPAFYQRLAIFPLTPNGKVDRRALPPPHQRSCSTDRKVLPTPSSLGERVANIWRFVLKTDDVAFDDNFFDVGGTSLLLIAVRTGLQEQLDRQIPIAWMFQHTTIRGLAARLAGEPPARTQSAFPAGQQRGPARESAPSTG